MRGQISAVAGDGDLAAPTLGMRGLLGHRQRAQSRTHLKLLLGNKVLHAPNDLDGGPMVLPQPAGEEEKGVSGHSARGVEPSKVSPAACGLGPSRNKENAEPYGIEIFAATSWGLWGGKAGGRGLFTSGVIPEGPFPCLSLRSEVTVRIPGSQWLCP